MFESSLNSRYNKVNTFLRPDLRIIMSDITRILNAAEQGDAGATEKLLPFVVGDSRLT